jgi:CRP/FNR family transcriptional regulator, cyclic AMP receptor protein
MNSGSLETLPESLLNDIAQRASTRTFAKDAIIVAEGDESDSLYLLLHGRAKVYTVDGKGNEIVLKQLGPGEYFGEVALDGGPRSASVIAVDDSRCVVVRRAELSAFMEEHPEFALHLVRKLAHRVREFYGSMRDLAFVDVYGRVARLLLDLAEDQDGRLVIADRPSDEGIAARVGATRDMVGRIFSDLVQSGYLVKENGRLVLVRKPPPALW